ncbi:MAG: enoyl-CoA hydratase/isomerase family protein [Bacteroidales bacterium]
MASHWLQEGPIGILTLPGTGGNYLEQPDFADVDWLRERFSNTGLKGIIIRGGGRHFSAGANLDKLKQLSGDETLLFHRMTAGKKLIQWITGAEVPVVAEISGVCFGGGLEIALACNIRICSENALFAAPEANYGIMPGLGGTITLSRLIGAGKAAEMIISGDIVNAEKALTLGLTDHVVPGRDLHSFTLEYLIKMTADRDTAVIRSIMKSIHHSQTMDFEKALEEETKLFCALAVRHLRNKE